MPALPVSLPTVAAVVVAPTLAVVTSVVVVDTPAAAPCTVSLKLVPSYGALLGLSTETADGGRTDQHVVSHIVVSAS